MRAQKLVKYEIHVTDTFFPFKEVKVFDSPFYNVFVLLHHDDGLITYVDFSNHSYFESLFKKHKLIRPDKALSQPVWRLSNAATKDIFQSIIDFNSI